MTELRKTTMWVGAEYDTIQEKRVPRINRKLTTGRNPWTASEFVRELMIRYAPQLEKDIIEGRTQ